MRVLVTGCGGFLGAEIVRQLIARGDQVVGLSRRHYPHLESLGMSQITGDVADLEAVRRAVEGSDAVIHTAAIAGVWGRWQDFHRTNTLATEIVIDACRAASVGRLVYTSSPSVTFDGSDQRGVDESCPYPTSWMCAYPQTKAMAEQSVLRAHRPQVLHTCALRPHLIWGEDDPHLLPRVIERARRGRLRIVGDGDNRIDTVHVVNAAAAHLDALDALRATPEQAGGRAYFIAQDEPVSCWEWIGTICDLAGVPRPSKRISYRAAYRLGSVLEGVYRWGRIRSEPPMTRFVAAQLARDHYFDISAAKERLGYRVRISMEEGLERLRQAWEERRKSGVREASSRFS